MTNNVKMTAQVVEMDGEAGEFALLLTVENISRREAIDVGELLHDAVTKAVTDVLSPRFTDETIHVTSRGTTQ